MNGALHLLLLALFFGIVEVHCAPCDNDVSSRSAIASSDEENNRIIDGKTDTEWRFKYAVALYISNQTHGEYQCTASIIGPRTVLTAAHCMDNMKKDERLSGMVGSAERTLGRQINFTEVIPHPRYDISLHGNDVGILKTAENILTGDDVMQACIASRRTELNQYKYVTAMGWGYTSKNLSRPISSDHLKYVELELNNHDFCKMRYPNMTEDVLCADGYGKDTCYGDSGGPLVFVNKKKKDIVIGITSSGGDNGKCGSMVAEPGIYTRVAAVEEWIVKTAGEDAKNICVKI